MYDMFFLYDLLSMPLYMIAILHDSFYIWYVCVYVYVFMCVGYGLCVCV